MKNLNPFIADPMLQYPEKFVGSEQELRAIVSRMRDSQTRHSIRFQVPLVQKYIEKLIEEEM